MFIFGVWQDYENIGVLDALIIALLAIIIVFLVLGIIILITYLFQKGIGVIDTKTKILPKEENKILDEDEDAAIALLVASIEFNKEFNKDPIVKKIERID